MMSRKHREIILENVLVEAVAAEGKALSHIDGAVLFIQFAVPGDIVDVRVTKKKKNYMEGYILRIVRPSEHRLEPFCSHFGICGGCKWQPLPYSMQLEAKQRQVYDQLVRIGHLDVPQLSPIIASDRTEYYRNKLEFTFPKEDGSKTVKILRKSLLKTGQGSVSMWEDFSTRFSTYVHAISRKSLRTPSGCS